MENRNRGGGGKFGRPTINHLYLTDWVEREYSDEQHEQFIERRAKKGGCARLLGTSALVFLLALAVLPKILGNRN